MQRDIAADVDIRPLVADNLSKLMQATCIFTKHPALSLIAVSHRIVNTISLVLDQ